ncbi:hypothetical protein [Mycobacterium szulgai]|uniref:hypothetical protein n=1 Tax=Mycobacterium szulgai TaxID=1787 RepID=UPI0021F34785|nr:hypothetical protein [Mycobacterium szulgai]MCV7079762.1 hypothetical protein [Mycobacterium szulgai]
MGGQAGIAGGAQAGGAIGAGGQAAIRRPRGRHGQVGVGGQAGALSPDKPARGWVFKRVSPGKRVSQAKLAS